MFYGILLLVKIGIPSALGLLSECEDNNGEKQ